MSIHYGHNPKATNLFLVSATKTLWEKKKLSKEYAQTCGILRKTQGKGSALIAFLRALPLPCAGSSAPRGDLANWETGGQVCLMKTR